MTLTPREVYRPVQGASRAATLSVSTISEKYALHGRRLNRTIRSANLSGTFPVRLRKYQRDTTIYEAGESPGLVGVLISGYLRTERIYGNGRRTIFGLTRPGEIIGNMSGRPSETTLAAATEIEIGRFEPDAVTRLVKKNRRFRLGLLIQATILRDLQFELIWQRGALSSRERVIAFLAMMAGFMPTEPLPDGSVIVTIDLSRRDWADMSNTAMETISRTMTELSTMGLVETAAPRRYRITDLRRLANMAGMDLSRFRSAPEAHSGGFPFKNQTAFPT
jgi:CRP/FNR family transcriptional regulator, anaerobic regulatory protein